MTYKHDARFPHVIWSVVADRARALILSAPWPEGEEWEEVGCLVHGESGQKPGEMLSDRKGSFASAGSSHHSGDEETDFKHHTAEVFASEIVACLEKAHTANKFGKLALVAPPLFLGVLRKKLPSPLAGMVVFELHKYYTHNSHDELAAHLQTALSEAPAE